MKIGKLLSAKPSMAKARSIDNWESAGQSHVLEGFFALSESEDEAPTTPKKWRGQPPDFPPKMRGLTPGPVVQKSKKMMFGMEQNKYEFSLSPLDFSWFFCLSSQGLIGAPLVTKRIV